MRSTKRGLLKSSTTSAIILTFALAWGGPILQARSAFAQDQADPQPQQKDEAKSATFTGTIVRNGEQFVLRDSKGKTYKLHDSESAKQYVGKAVTVKGQLDQEAMLIHVESIESAQG